MATDLDFSKTDIPSEDSAPEIDLGTADYNPEYPGSTEEAPYGFFDDGRPRKRKPRGGPEPTRLPPGWASSKTSTGSNRRVVASETKARQAASVLARGNWLLGIGLNALGMGMTADALDDANKNFEEMAFEALLTDPALCSKILNVGATGGKTALIMAYGMLGASVAPTAYTEMKTKRQERVTNE